MDTQLFLVFTTTNNVSNNIIVPVSLCTFVSNFSRIDIWEWTFQVIGKIRRFCQILPNSPLIEVWSLYIKNAREYLLLSHPCPPQILPSFLQHKIENKLYLFILICIALTFKEMNHLKHYLYQYSYILFCVTFFVCILKFESLFFLKSFKDSM